MKGRNPSWTPPTSSTRFTGAVSRATGVTFSPLRALQVSEEEMRSALAAMPDTEAAAPCGRREPRRIRWA
ncbi:hypothetical protein [Streptomyces dysideae]|uniref:Uncharacterized protein n=1 Tax=Streptomyces dysideae TaxID=909626 RepID=A0A117S0D3_9ACTN|nr:hypothetical protein [Streptomyces dysideae]KUO19247.1 hypothetical protein AQJ91_19905 [Streptomyces dysideae]